MATGEEGAGPRQRSAQAHGVRRTAAFAAAVRRAGQLGCST
ncbi:hypothetical protein [Streptomyces sp. HUAS ZL42]